MRLWENLQSLPRLQRPTFKKQIWLPRGGREGDLLDGAGAARPGLREERRVEPRLGDDRRGDVLRCGLPRRESRRPGDREPRLDL